jgi:hypothetical protein
MSARLAKCQRVWHKTSVEAGQEFRCGGENEFHISSFD